MSCEDITRINRTVMFHIKWNKLAFCGRTTYGFGDIMGIDEICTVYLRRVFNRNVELKQYTHFQNSLFDDFTTSTEYSCAVSANIQDINLTIEWIAFIKLRCSTNAAFSAALVLYLRNCNDIKYILSCFEYKHHPNGTQSFGLDSRCHNLVSSEVNISCILKVKSRIAVVILNLQLMLGEENTLPTHTTMFRVTKNIQSPNSPAIKYSWFSRNSLSSNLMCLNGVIYSIHMELTLSMCIHISMYLMHAHLRHSLALEVMPQRMYNCNLCFCWN